MTQTRRTLLLLLAASTLAAPFAAPTAAAQPTAAAGAATPAVSGPLPSALFAPALTQVRQALAIVRPEKWRVPSALNQATAANLASIQNDLDNTLPGLLATADGNPASVSEVLPAYRNVEALYEVLLRVTEISKLAAPAQQSVALQQALQALESSRRTLGEQLQTSSVNQSHAIVALQTELRESQAAAASARTAAPVCPTPTTTRHHTKARSKSTSGSTSGAQPATSKPQ